MERKNTDWSISLDEGVDNKKLVELFFKECGLEPFGEYTIERGVTWGRFGGKYAIRDIEKPSKPFKIPSQWSEAKKYICEEKSVELEEGKWYKFGDRFIGRFSYVRGLCTYIGDVLRDNKYMDEGWMGNHEYSAVELTPDEIKKHLIACAEARGYKLNNSEKWLGVSGTIYNIKTDTLYKNFNVIYQRGEWAKKVEEIKYPCVMINKKQNIIVEFKSEGLGTVLYKGDMNGFEPFSI